VVLRPEAIRERLLRLEEVISHLEELRADRDAGGHLGFRDEWSIERGLQLGAEILFDVGNHILSAHLGVIARDYEDIIAQLAGMSVIPGALREDLRGLGGFRNILVHGYLILDEERVAEHLKAAPARFAAFAAAIREWLARTLG